MRKTVTSALGALWIGACGGSDGSGGVEMDKIEAPSTDPGGSAQAGSGPAQDDTPPVVVEDTKGDTMDDAGKPAGEGATCDSGKTTALVLSKVVFVREASPGVARGFNLDGVDTERGEAASCNSADFVDPDGESGIDNQLALLVPALEKVTDSAAEDLLQGGINDGSLLQVLEVLTDDLSADQCVTVTMRSAKGRPSLGTDGFLEPNQTFALDAEGPTSQTTGARIDAGVVTAGPFKLDFPLRILNADTVLDITDAYLRFTINDAGAVQGGLVGGAIALAKLHELAMVRGVGQEVVDSVLPVADKLADMNRNEDGVCERMSAGLEFDAVPVFLAK